MKAARKYVCVRVTNMAGVDLDVYRFDYDLTFCALLMNADGTIYHTYGGRNWTDPNSHLSVVSMTRVLEETLADHVAYQKAPRPPPKSRGRHTVERMGERLKKKKPECYHCHNVNDFTRELAKRKRRYSRDMVWIYPDPVEVGLKLDRDVQTRVTEVEAGSPAAKAGLAKDDRLTTLGGMRVRTFGDVQTVLHDADGTTLAVAWTRGDKEHAGTLKLKKGWKEPTPLVFSWRSSKWPMSPKPGFGGQPLGAERKRQLSVPADAFAFRVGYLVTWGPNAYTGRNAHRAGIRKNDVILSVAGKSDFHDMHHFHAWFRLTRKPGTKVKVELIRRGERKTITLPVLE